MLIDFCHHCVRSKIKSDKVSFDGYEVQNLISGDLDEKRKGFLSDHFIKPPVNVTVQFPCNVSISRIVIDPVIGQQMSCDLKIFTACEKMTDSWLYSKNSDRTVKTDGIIFNCVGSVSMNEPALVCFVNNQFKERNAWRLENIPDLSRYPSVSQLNARKPGGLCNASHVTVCVNRSKSSKSVAIRRLEIWGCPSVKVPNPVQMTLKNTYLASIKQKNVVHKGTPSAKVSSTSSCAAAVGSDTQNEDNKVLIEGVSVPEDFIDQITFDIMTVPLVLPCGKVIDRSTLERHINSEASWGRQPSDPFTGVVFSQGASPVANSSLKARIDQFVLKHSDSLKIPQTLGHTDVYKARENAAVLSKLVPHQSSTSTKDKFSVSNCETSFSKQAHTSLLDTSEGKKAQLKSDKIHKTFLKTSEICGMNNSEFPRCHKRKQPTGEFSQSHLNPKKVKKANDIPFIDLTKNEQKDVSIYSNIKATKKRIQDVSDHKSDLSKSLDNALLSTLAGLPSFIKKPSKDKLQPTDSVNESSMCCKCKSNLIGTDAVKYKMPCGHLICRSCLVQENISFTCLTCASPCLSSQAVRVF